MLIEFIKLAKWLVGTSLFGTLIGFFLGKFSSDWNDQKKIKEQGYQLLRNLLNEISSNRLKCQAVLQGRDPVYFEVLSWDSVRLNQCFSKLYINRALVDNLYNLYLSVYAANIRVAAVLVAIDSTIRGNNPTNIQTTNQMVKDFINVELLPRLNAVEGDLAGHLREYRIIR